MQGWIRCATLLGFGDLEQIPYLHVLGSAVWPRHTFCWEGYFRFVSVGV